MKTTNTPNQLFRLREQYKTRPLLPDPLNGRLIIQTPVLSETTEEGIFVGSIAHDLIPIPNQAMVVASDNESIPVGTIIAYGENAIYDSFKVEGTMFYYVKAEHVLSILPPTLSVFHENATP